MLAHSKGRGCPGSARALRAGKQDTSPRRAGCGEKTTLSENLSAWVLELPWPSRSGNNHRKFGQGRAYTTPPALAYRAEVRRISNIAGISDRYMTGPFSVRMVLRPPDRRVRDGDNVEKVVWDAVVGAGVLADDSRQVLPRVLREWAEPDGPGAILLSATATA